MLENRQNGQENEFYVVEEASLVLDVVQIHVDHLIEFHVASAMGLPFPGQSLGNEEAKLVLLGIGLIFLDGARSWTHNGHVSLEDVEELWKFIQGSSADEVAELGNSGIVLHLEHPPPTTGLIVLLQLLQFGFGIHAHGTELVEIEDFPVFSDSLGNIDDWSLGCAFDQDGNDEHEPGKKKDGKEGGADVEGALEKSIALSSLDLDGHLFCLFLIVRKRNLFPDNTLVYGFVFFRCFLAIHVFHNADS